MNIVPKRNSISMFMQFCTLLPTLTFDGATANRSVSITALGKPITATLELWQGSTRVASWSDSATSRLIIDEDYSVDKGKTYTLKVSGTIDGKPLAETCPK